MQDDNTKQKRTSFFHDLLTIYGNIYIEIEQKNSVEYNLLRRFAYIWR